VPALVLLFDQSPEEAVGATALAVLLIASTATVSYLPRKRVEVRMALAVAATGVPTAILGGWLLAEYVSGRWFEVGLGACFLLLAAAMFAQMRAPAREDAPPSLGVLALGGGLVGIITGAFAAGGGLLTVPMLMRWGRLPIQRATATTSLAI